MDARLPGNSIIPVFQQHEFSIRVFIKWNDGGVQLPHGRELVFYHQENTGPLYWKRWVKVSLKFRNAAVVPTWPLDLSSDSILIYSHLFRLGFLRLTFPRWLEASGLAELETCHLSKLGSGLVTVLALRPFGVQTYDDQTPCPPITVIQKVKLCRSFCIRGTFINTDLENRVEFITQILDDIHVGNQG